jgi:hypothetical protein
MDYLMHCAMEMRQFLIFEITGFWFILVLYCICLQYEKVHYGQPNSNRQARAVKVKY